MLCNKRQNLNISCLSFKYTSLIFLMNSSQKNERISNFFEDKTLAPVCALKNVIPDNIKLLQLVGFETIQQSFQQAIDHCLHDPSHACLIGHLAMNPNIFSEHSHVVQVHFKYIHVCHHVSIATCLSLVSFFNCSHTCLAGFTDYARHSPS